MRGSTKGVPMTTVRELIEQLQFEADHQHGDMEVVLSIGLQESDGDVTVEFTDNAVVIEA
jgi:hypothetical protein